ncbi:universal stress protein [Mycobacterium sp. NPDC003323]
MSDDSVNQVIVGIDGSEQAEHAALWAVAEARRCGGILRLIYVIRTDLSGMLTAGEYDSAVGVAKRALLAAQRRIEERDASVTVTTTIAQGSPAGVLRAESTNARMICLGWTGMNRTGIVLMGSTATTAALEATCPVAIIRTHQRDDARKPQSRWVIVPVGADSRDEDTVVTDAVSEAEQRGWPILALWTDAGADQTRVEAVNLLVSKWRQRFSEVHIYPVATERGLAQFLHASPELGGLIMIDGDLCPDVASTIRGIGHATAAELAVVVARRATSLQRAHRPTSTTA